MEILRCFKAVFDAVKSNVGLLNTFIKTKSVSIPPLMSVGNLRCLRSDLNVVKI